MWLVQLFIKLIKFHQHTGVMRLERKCFFESMKRLTVILHFVVIRQGEVSVYCGEPRIKVAVLAAGGLRFTNPPETLPANFQPRVKIPVLTVNGRDDFSAPLQAQQKFSQLFGTAPEHKKHVSLEGGHAPNDFRALFRETLDWLDKYLGRVR